MTKDQVKAVLERVPTWPEDREEELAELALEKRQNSPAPNTTRHRTNWRRSMKGLPGKPRATRKSERPSPCSVRHEGRILEASRRRFPTMAVYHARYNGSEAWSSRCFAF